MGVSQGTTATTLNPSPDKKVAAGKNIKWKMTSPGTTPALTGRSEQLETKHVLAFI
jgi:hypothetical protein